MPTRLADDSCGLINRALGDFRQWHEIGAAVGGAQRRGRLGRRSGSEAEWRIHSMVLLSIAVSEDFAMARLDLAMEAILPLTVASVEWVWTSYFDTIRDWRRRSRVWQEAKDVKFSTFPAWPSLEAFVEVRNTLAHRVGALSRRQRTNVEARTELERKLSPIGVEMGDGRLWLGSAHAERCAEVAKEFIQWLDREAA